MAKAPALAPVVPELIFMVIGENSYVAYVGSDPEFAQRMASILSAVVVSMPVLWDYRGRK